MFTSSVKSSVNNSGNIRVKSSGKSRDINSVNSRCDSNVTREGNSSDISMAYSRFNSTGNN